MSTVCVTSEKEMEPAGSGQVLTHILDIVTLDPVRPGSTHVAISKSWVLLLFVYFCFCF